MALITSDYAPIQVNDVTSMLDERGRTARLRAKPRPHNNRTEKRVAAKKVRRAVVDSGLGDPSARLLGGGESDPGVVGGPAPPRGARGRRERKLLRKYRSADETAVLAGWGDGECVPVGSAVPGDGGIEEAMRRQRGESRQSSFSPFTSGRPESARCGDLCNMDYPSNKMALITSECGTI